MFSCFERRCFLGTAVVVAGLVAICGCGDNLASLRGTVYVDGKPAPKGMALVFDPIDKSLLPAYGFTDGNGQYRAQFTFRKDGIQPGEYVAHLSLAEAGDAYSSGNTPAYSDRRGADGLRVFKYPRKYYDEIVRLTVSGGRNVVDLSISTTE